MNRITNTLALISSGNAATGVCGIYGISGVGKTSLAVTAAEAAWEEHRAITRWYASDLGGWGNKLLSLIRLGIVQLWYLRNHNDPFATMEDASRGYWPETISDPETGLAAPDVRLIAPERVSWQVICQNGHVAVTCPQVEQVALVNMQCPTCAVVVNATTAARVDKVRVRSKGFKNVGHYVYDSMTQLNEFGLQSLKDASANGSIGDVLGSANALESGGYKFGTSSRAQFGFVQDRTPVWIGNIRSIPGQVIPPTMTFGVEMSKGDDESGGNPVYGPKIAGNARTSSVPGWLGNCLHATREQNAEGEMRHRLWFVNHIDPRDPRAIPYMAKHRGVPFGMPREGYLEDDGIAENAWKVCSLRVFYRLLAEQAAKLLEADAARYQDAPAFQKLDEDDQQEQVVGVVSTAGTEVVAQTEIANAPRGGGRVLRRGRRPAVEVAEAATVPTTMTAVAPPAVTAPSMEPPTTIAPHIAVTASGALTPADVVPVPAAAASAGSFSLPAPSEAQSLPAGSSRRIVRRPRPPV